MIIQKTTHPTFIYISDWLWDSEMHQRQFLQLISYL